MLANLAVDQTAVIGAEVAVTTGVAQNARSEVIAGYVLEERIGVGGYGEVWRAIGPGGLPKAVKILHGQHDGPQADAELKSLERMRALRHPFLISIERIEVIDDRLIIVTELAEGSLEARFKQVRRAGHRGIPSDELLGYMRDAADALDFLVDRHGLQHLDVKPSNLLLQGEHLKVADFGLVKDIRQAHVSLVGGFTPLYAPPELFEGRPCRNSDQYSLAICYQMMLTGTPPFAGRTAAQLTAQHLNSPPDLASLPLSDRPAVTRALSKKPGARFESCRQFVDRLSERNPKESRSQASRVPAGQSLSRPTGIAPPPGGLPSSDTTTVRTKRPNLAAVPLPPVNQSPLSPTYRPTIFLGIGGLGGRVLRSLRRQLTDRFGEDLSLPALPLLYIDTDPQGISASRTGDDGSVLQHNEALAIPLREPKDYRSYSGELLQWLSRRWLYNIPKSRRAEGIRPLGRLALVDHHKAIRNRIREVVEKATSDDALRLTGDTTGLPLEKGPPDVVFVASISGGTGSGAVLDAAYLVRDVLSELQLEKATISATLLCAPGSRSQANKIELSNAVACLKELERYGSAHADYPGDPTCELPASDRCPFDNVHVVHLGDASEPAACQQELEKTAEYLYRRVASPARAFFEACRREDEDGANPSGETASLKTFGIAAHRGTADENALNEAESLCQALMRRWRGAFPPSAEGRPASEPGVAQRTHALFDKLRLGAEQVAATATTMTQGELGKRMDTYFHARWARLHTQESLATSDPGSLVNAIDREYSTQRPEDKDAEHPAAILRHLQRQLHSSAQKCVHAVQGELLAIMNGSAKRLDGASEALGDFVFRLNESAENLVPLVQKIRGDLEQLKRAAAPDGGNSNGGTTSEPGQAESTAQRHLSLCRRYFMLKFCEGIWLCWMRYLQTIRDTVTQTVPVLTSLQARLQELEDHFGRAIKMRDCGSTSGTRAERESNAPAACDAIDEFLVRAFDDKLRLDGRIGPASFMSNEQNRGWKGASDSIRNEALTFLAGQGLAPASQEDSSVMVADDEANLVESVAPRIANVGGGRRVLAVIPNHTTPADWQQRLAAKFGNCVTMQPGADSEFFFYCEVEGIAIPTVIDHLACEHAGILEMASRLHTRIDVEWEAGQ